MYDVFISYARMDFDVAKRLAGIFERFALSPWWDDRIELSKPWDEAIYDNLKAIHSVVVLWTGNSVSSEWVRQEASYALDRNKYLSIAFRGAVPPDRFGSIQAANLPRWEENTLPRAIRRVLNEVADRAGKPPVLDEHTDVLSLEICSEKVRKFVASKKHHENYFPKLDGPLYADIWAMMMQRKITLYDELKIGSRHNLTEDRYYELIEYLSKDTVS
jgi:TIR domain